MAVGAARRDAAEIALARARQKLWSEGSVVPSRTRGRRIVSIDGAEVPASLLLALTAADGGKRLMHRAAACLLGGRIAAAIAAEARAEIALVVDDTTRAFAVKNRALGRNIDANQPFADAFSIALTHISAAIASRLGPEMAARFDIPSSQPATDAAVACLDATLAAEGAT